MSLPHDKREFIQRLDDLLVRLDMTAAELGDAADISATTLSRWRTLPEMPTNKSMGKIARATGCSVEWLRNGKGEMFPGNGQGNGHRVTSAKNSVISGSVGRVQYKQGNQGDQGRQLPDDLDEIVQLLLDYGNPALLKQIKKRLEEIKKLSS